jgi:hypothetical protein
MTRSASWSRRGLALAAAIVAVGLCVLLGIAPTAAARTVTGPTDGLSISDIRSGRTVDLEIRMPRRNPFDDPAAGSLARPPLAGTEFTARRLEGIDLTTAGGWETARALAIAAAERGPFGHSASAVTDDAGVARLQGLPIGLYLVTSVTPGRGHRGGFAPFLITLPTGGEAGWNHTPVVYAKPDSRGPGIILPPFPFPIPWPGSSDGAPADGHVPGGSIGPDGSSGSGAPDAPGGAGGPGASGGNTTPSDGRSGREAAAASAPEGATARGALAVTGTAVGLLAGVGAVLVGIGLVVRYVARAEEGSPSRGAVSGGPDPA